jgi:ferric-dicitrate binding protein FerR (iron transport regulator)
MTEKQLEALLIDQALGETSGETDALLEAWLEKSPEHRDLAGRIRGAVGLTEGAVVSRPLDLEAAEILAFPSSGARPHEGFRIAAAIAVLGVAVGLGYLAGKGSDGSSKAGMTAAKPEVNTAPSPWARYRVDDNGRLAVILPAPPKP